MSTPYRPHFPNQLGALVKQKRLAANEKERLAHVQTLLGQAIAELTPLVQAQHPDVELSFVYAFVVDAQEALARRRQEGGKDDNTP